MDEIRVTQIEKQPEWIENELAGITNSDIVLAQKCGSEKIGLAIDTLLV